MEKIDVKTPTDFLNFMEGCLNDFESGVSSKDETMQNLIDLFEFTAKRAKEIEDNQSKTH